MHNLNPTPILIIPREKVLIHMNKKFSDYSKEYFDTIKQPNKIWSDISFTLVAVISAFILFFVVPRFFYEVVVIEGNSMLPTIQNEDKVRILKTKNINYLDIVVIDSEGLQVSEDAKYIIKRVIGLEGDTVWVDFYEDAQEYRIYRSRVNEDGETKIDILDEPYINKMHSDALTDANRNKEYKVPKGCVFVIGDNRNNTYKGIVDINKILGKGVTILTKSPVKFIGIEIDWYKSKRI